MLYFTVGQLSSTKQTWDFRSPTEGFKHLLSCLLAPKVFLEDRWPMITIHLSTPDRKTKRQKEREKCEMTESEKRNDKKTEWLLSIEFNWDRISFATNICTNKHEITFNKWTNDTISACIMYMHLGKGCPKKHNFFRF